MSKWTYLKYFENFKMVAILRSWRIFTPKVELECESHNKIGQAIPYILRFWSKTLKNYKLLYWAKIHLWVTNSEDMSQRSWFMRENVLISFKHEYRRLILSTWYDVTGDVISMKILFPGLLAYDRSRSDVELRLPLEILKILKFSKVTKFWGPGELFRRECHRKLVC